MFSAPCVLCNKYELQETIEHDECPPLSYHLYAVPGQSLLGQVFWGREEGEIFVIGS